MSSKIFSGTTSKEFSEILPGMLLSVYGLGMLGYLTIISWSAPVLDLFAFRQTQTALSIYWMQKGGPLLAYETPVAGYPWSIPFEFPIYQWLVALLAGLTNLSIDQAGRIVGVAFFLGAAGTLYKIVSKLSSNLALSFVCVGVFLSSPLAAFWARSVMIESTALFFSLGFIYGVIQYHLTGEKRFIFIVTFFAIFAALIKITTFYCFAVALALSLLVLLIRDFSTSRLKQTISTGLLAGAAVIISLLLLIMWVRYSDSLKQQTVIGNLLTSSAISEFNFGTLAERLDIHSWRSIIFGRATYQILGSGWIFLIAACIVILNTSFWWCGLVLLLGYIAPFLTFTNLHYVHSYYQFANFVFLTMIVGLAIGSLVRKGIFGLVAAYFGAFVIMFASWHTLQTYFVPTITKDQSQSRTIELARFVRSHTGSDQALLIFGMDWSSELPYYGARKAVAVPAWYPAEDLKRLFNPLQSFGSEKLGALITCPIPSANKVAENDVYDAIIKKYSSGRSVRMISGCLVYF